MSIPLSKKKFSSKEIVTAKQFAQAFHYENILEKYGASGLILMWNPNHFKEFVKPLKPRKVNAMVAADVYVAKVKGRNVFFATRFGAGGPAMAHLLEELSARGIKTFINFGGGGGISSNLKCGDIVIVDKALRDEGTSYHYLKPRRYVKAPKELLTNLITIAKSKKIKFVTGPVWTTDAMFRETEAELITYRKEGILCVDMEIASLFAVSKVRELQSASIMVIYDVLDVDGWKLRTTGLKKRQENLKKAFDVALTTLLHSE